MEKFTSSDEGRKKVVWLKSLQTLFAFVVYEIESVLENKRDPFNMTSPRFRGFCINISGKWAIMTWAANFFVIVKSIKVFSEYEKKLLTNYV